MLVLIYAFVILSSVAGEDCKLPLQRQPINWDRFNNHWYESVTVNDPLDADMGCYLIRHTENTTDGGFGLLIDYREPSPYKEIHTHVILQPSGAYLWDKKGKKEWHSHKFSSVQLQDKFDAEVENLFTEHVFYTNYETYFIDLMCEDDGKKIIWFQSRTQYPSAGDILPAINKLKDVGEGWDDVLLFPSGCSLKAPYPGDAP